jgi:hypothetical protein
MVKYLAMIQTNQLNLFPAKGGVSKYYSPRMILTQEVLDYEKHFKIPFGSFVQATHESEKKNSNLARTLDCIYLRPNNSMQGGHELMDLTTGRVITRNRVKVIPLSDFIIRTVERMADEQQMKELKFRNRFGQIYNDIDLIAGVENEEEQDDNEDDIDDEDYIPANDDDHDDDAGFYEDDIDPEEVEDLLDENLNENGQHQPDQDDRSDNDQEDDPQDDQNDPEVITDVDESTSGGSELRRSSRTRSQVQRLEPTMRGQSYHEFEKGKNLKVKR